MGTCCGNIVNKADKQIYSSTQDYPNYDFSSLWEEQKVSHTVGEFRPLSWSSLEVGSGRLVAVLMATPNPRGLSGKGWERAGPSPSGWETEGRVCANPLMCPFVLWTARIVHGAGAGHLGAWCHAHLEHPGAGHSGRAPSEKCLIAPCVC